MSKSGFKTKTDAVAALAEIQSRLDNGTFVERSRQTLGEFLEDDWLPAAESTVRLSTYRSYVLHVRKYISPRIGRRRLQQLDGAEINRLYSELLSDGRISRVGGLSPSTVQRIHATLHRALRDAVRWGRLNRNPADQADPPKVQPGQRPEMAVWSAEELAAFLEAVSGERLYAMWVLTATTGMRRGEVLGLKWDDLDLDQKTLSVRRTQIAVGGKIIESEPKTKRGQRQIALDSSTTSSLRIWRVRQLEERVAWGPSWIDSGFVFTNEDGSPVNPERLSRMFKRFVEASGLPMIRMHDLRHTHATLALRAGIHPKVVSERLGHATVAITMDTYTHAIPAMQEEAAEKVAQLVFGTT